MQINIFYMLDFLDLRTLSFVAIFFGLCFGLGLMAYSSTLEKFKMASQIGLGVFFVGISHLLLSLRGYINDFVSIIIANELIIISLMLIYSGLHELCQSKLNINKNLTYILLVFVFSSLIYYTYIEPSMMARIIIIIPCVSLLCMLCAYVLFSFKIKTNLLPSRILGTIFSITAIIELLRLALDAELSNIIDLKELNGIHTLLFFVALALIPSISFCVIWITNLKLQGELKNLSEIDHLTKINNRRSLEKLAEIELSRATRNNQPLSVILCDIDHFKQINDQYGHQVGDNVLSSLSALFTKNMRKHDIVARYGGEEFLLLLPNTHIEKAMKVAEKLRMIIAKNEFTNTGTATLSVTVSLGVASNNEKSNSWDNIVKAADEALYKAKKSGRNQVFREAESLVSLLQ